MSRIEQIETRLAKAHRGPWKAINGSARSIVRHVSDVEYEVIGVRLRDQQANADFIAHSREDIELLLPVLKAALKVVEAWDNFEPKFDVIQDLRTALLPFTEPEPAHE